MLRRFFRTPLVKIMLLIETAVAVIVMTNLWALADKYFISKTAEAKGLDYAHTAVFDVGVDTGDADRGESEAEVRNQISGFLADMRGLGGNVSLYPVAGDIGDGDRAAYTLYLSAEEELPAPTEGGAKDFGSNKGVYVGNYNANYIKDGALSAFADQLEVIGIMASSGFDRNEFIYIKYADLSEVSRNEAAEDVLKRCYNRYDSDYGDKAFTLRAESNFITEEKFRQKFENIIGRYTFLTYKDGDTGAVQPVESTVMIYSGIKNVFLILAVLMCAGLLFQTMQIYLHNEGDNILIKKTFGMNERQIFLPLCAQVAVIFVGAVILALILETVIYGFAMRYNVIFILKSLAAASAVSAVLELLVLAAAYLKFRLTGMSLASRLSGVEE